MLREICRAKIHRLTVTETDLNYSGSLTLDKKLLDAAGIAPYERAQVVSVTTGARFDTYVLPGDEQGIVCVNGAAARLAEVGDLIIVITYALFDEKELKNFKPRIVIVDSKNKVVKI